MSPSFLLLILLSLSALGYHVARKRSHALAGRLGGLKMLHSRPVYYGVFTALWCLIPALIVFGFWMVFESNVITGMVIEGLPDSVKTLPESHLRLVVNDIKNLAGGNIVSGKVNPAMEAAAVSYNNLEEISHAALAVIAVVLSLGALVLGTKMIKPEMRARNRVEQVVNCLLVLCSSIAVFTTIGIVLSVIYEAIRFFQVVPLIDFVTGLEWSPQMAIRSDQVGSSGAFGAVPVFVGTLLITLIAMTVALPIGLMSAIFLSEYADRKFRAVAKPLLEILAGVPTVVYGFFAALVVSPMIRNSGTAMGLTVSSESALAAGLVMGVMIIPFVSSLSDDVINAVPQSLRDGALGLGSTRSETVKLVVIPAALPGIVGGVLLAVSRAIGETMIVVMAAGLSASMNVNPLKTVTTVTVQIVTLLVGDQEFDSPKTLAAFALGLMLFLVTLVLNIVALYVVRKYREQYE